MAPPVRIGTRGSQLALWQAHAVAGRLEAAGVATELVVIRTSGDRLQEAPLSEVGGKRLFVKELEDALLRGEIDAAVHSAKDMPAVLPETLAIAATLPREDPRDALVLPGGSPGGSMEAVLAGLGSRPRIGTSSVRRSAQLRALLPAASFLPIRGNVDTRLRKLDAGEFDALVLAAAGLRRLGLASRISASLDPAACVPAPGQGIVAVEVRSADQTTRARLGAVHDGGAGFALEAERAVVAALGGGCQLPLGAYAALGAATIELHAVVCSLDGAHAVRAHASGRPEQAADIGRQAAADLADGGAGALLDAVRGVDGSVEGSY